jgi:hypothetical protein
MCLVPLEILKHQIDGDPLNFKRRQVRRNSISLMVFDARRSLIFIVYYFPFVSISVLMIGLLKCKADRSEHHQDRSRYHQPMRILHLGKHAACLLIYVRIFRHSSVRLIARDQISESVSG